MERGSVAVNSGEVRSNHEDNIACQAGVEAWRAIEEAGQTLVESLPEVVRSLGFMIGSAIQKGIITHSLGNHATYPFYELLEANNISRSVGDRLREEGKIRPIIVYNSGNPILYITRAEWKRFVDSCSEAPPPSRSRLARSKRRKGLA